MSFKVLDGDIEGLKIIQPFYVEDNRGYFLKSFERNIYKELKLENIISEDFESFSSKNVIRGMHFQIHNPQIKMVRAITGEILDVAIDLRKGSPTFGKWQSVILSEDNHQIFYIPQGFAHGFKVLSENAIVSYKCIGDYDKETDTGINWKDSDLAIDWGIDKGVAIVSDKDNSLMSLSEFKRLYGGL